MLQIKVASEKSIIDSYQGVIISLRKKYLDMLSVNCNNAECHLLSVIYDTSVILLGVVMLRVIMMSAIMPSVIVLCVIILIAII